MLISAGLHFAAVYALVVTAGDDPAPVLRETSVSFFEIAPASAAPLSPAPTRSNVSPPPTAIQLPDLQIDTRYLVSTDPLSPTISLQELNLSTLSAGMPGLPAEGPPTTLPLLLNQAEAEQELRRRAESLQIADTVHLHLLIDEQGQVREARIGQSSGSAVFDRLATEIITGIGKFLPAQRAGVPIAVWVGFPVSVEKVASLP